MPSAAHASTSGSPNSMYGPTVVMTTFVDAAIARSDSGSPESATIVGTSAPIVSSVLASLSRLRPAIAHFVPGVGVLGEVLRSQRAGESGRAVDDDVVLAFGHGG